MDKNKEAIAIVRQMVTDGQVAQDVAEKYFPELAESEDEKIRKEIIEHIKYCSESIPERAAYIAWLEKQGEHANFLSKIQIGDKVTRNKDGVLVNLSQLKRIAKPAEEYNITGIGSKNAQGKLGEMIKNLKPVNEVLEQKPDWNEKYIADVFEKVGLAKIAREQSNDNLTNALQDAMIELSKFIPQPKQEWSEEDEKMLQSALWHVSNSVSNGKQQDIKCDLTEWLKSRRPQTKQGLSEDEEGIIATALSNTYSGDIATKLLNKIKSFRPQKLSNMERNGKNWKPSEEQMEALESATENCAYSEYQDCLRELIEQLKK